MGRTPPVPVLRLSSTFLFLALILGLAACSDAPSLEDTTLISVSLATQEDLLHEETAHAESENGYGVTPRAYDYPVLRIEFFLPHTLSVPLDVLENRVFLSLYRCDEGTHSEVAHHRTLISDGRIATAHAGAVIRDFLGGEEGGDYELFAYYDGGNYPQGLEGPVRLVAPGGDVCLAVMKFRSPVMSMLTGAPNWFHHGAPPAHS